MSAPLRRLPAVFASAGIALASLTGCGLIGGTAVDCVLVADAMTETVNNLQADEATFGDSVGKLREEAAGIEDADLREAIETFATNAEAINAIHNNPEEIVTRDPVDIADLMAQQDVFAEKCTSF